MKNVTYSVSFQARCFLLYQLFLHTDVSAFIISSLCSVFESRASLSEEVFVCASLMYIFAFISSLCKFLFVLGDERGPKHVSNLLARDRDNLLAMCLARMLCMLRNCLYNLWSVCYVTVCMTYGLYDCNCLRLT